MTATNAGCHALLYAKDEMGYPRAQYEDEVYDHRTDSSLVLLRRDSRKRLYPHATDLNRNVLVLLVEKVGGWYEVTQDSLDIEDWDRNNGC